MEHFPTETKAKERLHARFGIDIERSFEAFMNELGYKPCKVDGCLNRIDKEKGPYGGLCVKHATERKTERAAEKMATKATRKDRKQSRLSLSLAPPDSVRKTLVEHADLLPDLTRVLQERTEAFHSARSALRDAVVEYDRVLKAMSVSAAELLGKDADGVEKTI